MKKSLYLVLSILIGSSTLLPLHAQDIERKTLTWEQKKIDIGAVLEENGPVETEFFAVNQNNMPIYITDVITDCGCTSVHYSTDTLSAETVGSIRVQFDPDHRGGYFLKAIVVRTNEDIYGDTLFLEGFNMPIPEDIDLAFPHRVGEFGLRLSAINLGNVFTNEPKTKQVEIYNFSTEPLELALEEEEDSLQHVAATIEPSPLMPKQRGIMQVTYDGDKKRDLGFFDERLALNFKGIEEPVDVRLMANVLEFFAPIAKSMEKIVPRLEVSDVDIDFRDISASRPVSRSVTIENSGKEILSIRKISTNCDCITANVSAMQLEEGDKVTLQINFDPRGRKGIDHKHISIFSNDPLTPVKTITVRSSVK